MRSIANTRWRGAAARHVVATVLLGLRQLCMHNETKTDQQMGTSKKRQMHYPCSRTHKILLRDSFSALELFRTV